LTAQTPQGLDGRQVLLVRPPENKKPPLREEWRLFGPWGLLLLPRGLLRLLRFRLLCLL